ncbi:gamma-glutamyltranspeptidase [Raoultella ornithinolytica]|nr:gamma-glutamyltranspeptidase [Raoultella ornithinolytica]
MINTRSWRQVVIAALLAGGSFAVSANPTPPPVSYGVEEDVFHPVRAREGMVASVDATATRVGVDILRQGGQRRRCRGGRGLCAGGYASTGR